MKKQNTLFLFLLGIFLFLTSASMAQSLQVLDKEGNDVSGSVLMVWGDSGYWSTMAMPLDVKNISGTTANVKSKVILNSMQPGSTYSFCFNGNCYLPPTLICPTAAQILAGATDTTFIGEYKPRGTLGESINTYSFFKTSDPNDSAFVIVQFNSTPAGLEQYAEDGFEISVPYPNPASTHASFTYSFPENSSPIFTLSDITGNILKEVPIYNTNGILDISTIDLSEGMYFYSFYLDGKRLMTKKLIVQ